jgi:hypothetical protein
VAGKRRSPLAQGLLWGAGSLVVLVAAALLLYRACAWVDDHVELFECGNDLLAQHLSPDMKRKVVVFTRNCGGTTPFSTHASIMDADDELPKDVGNVFGAATGAGRAPAGPGGGPELRAKWVDDRHVVLSHHASVVVFKSESQHDGVTVVVERFQ